MKIITKPCQPLLKESHSATFYHLSNLHIRSLILVVLINPKVICSNTIRNHKGNCSIQKPIWLLKEVISKGHKCHSQHKCSQNFAELHVQSLVRLLYSFITAIQKLLNLMLSNSIISLLCGKPSYLILLSLEVKVKSDKSRLLLLLFIIFIVQAYFNIPLEITL